MAPHLGTAPRAAKPPTLRKYQLHHHGLGPARSLVQVPSAGHCGDALPARTSCGSLASPRALVPVWLMGPGEAERVPGLWGWKRACPILPSSGVEEGW